MKSYIKGKIRIRNSLECVWVDNFYKMDYAFNVSLDLWILIIYVLGEFEIKTNLEISMARNYFLPSFKSTWIDSWRANCK